MKLIIRSKYKWTEPVGYYKIMRALIKEHTPMWRYLLGNAIILFGAPIVFGTISLVFKRSLSITLAIFMVSFLVQALMVVASWYETRKVWVLDDCIACQSGNKYRYWKYLDIASANIEKLEDQFGPYDLLSILMKHGETDSFVLSPKIDRQGVLDFLRSKIANGNQ